MIQTPCVVLSLVLSLASFFHPSLGSAHLTASPQAHSSYERTFAVGENPTLILDNTSVQGNIEVQSWDRPYIQLSADIHSANTFIETSSSTGALKVKLRRKGMVSTEPVHFRVWVPATCEVELSGMSGKITVRGVRARLKVLTTDGDIELIDVEGPNVDATSSTNGKITLVSSLNPKGKYHLYSAAGQINVMLKEPSSFTLDAATGEGRILVNGFQLANERRSEGHLQGTHGDGRSILMLRSVHGLIQLRKQ